MHSKPIVRPAKIEDIETMTLIYNQGIRSRKATFEANEREPQDLIGWFERPNHPLLVAEENNKILGWIAASSYRSRDCYAGIAEFSIYIHESARGKGVGSLLMPAFFDACTKANFWKILSRVFTENEASLRLCQKHGFRQVGTYEKHAKLDGIWKDVVIVEKILEQNL